ncbi:MAG TPA: zf-HC2 domain-containing protein, partial [Planctomycetota bacterium]|nr:zf-HC2 domain-containing protein [Planctomycetota bacterium]
MLCTEEMGTLLSRYVDGELAEKERKSIETHLEACASCRDVLNLFQRNDNVLNNALVGEAFGAQTVDAVMTEIRRLEEPMVVAPAVDAETPSEPVAMRQVIEVTRMWPFAAAAAMMIACVGGVFAITKFGGGGGVSDRQLAALHKSITEGQESNDRTTRALLDRVSEMSQELKDAEVKAVLKTTKETVVAYVNDRAIVVQANYSTEKFYPFQIFRTQQLPNGSWEDWKTICILAPTPFYRDTSVVPGVNYMYQMRAIYRGSDNKRYEDSPGLPQMLPLAGGLDPRRSLKIRLIGALPDLSEATFEVSRYDNEKLITRYYSPKIGEKIGDIELVDGKEVDFS